MDLLESLVPVFGAIVGGLLAIFGGLMVARTTDRRERRKIYLEKLEAIHAVATEVLAWSERHIQQAMVAPAGQWDLQALKIRAPTERLSVLVDMYETSLRLQVDRLLESVEGQRDAEFDYYGALQGAGESTMAVSSNDEVDGEGPDSAPGTPAKVDTDAMDSAFDRMNDQNSLVHEHYRQLEAAIVSAVHRRAR
jgi:hypothetical protein